jgi:hypothetical protein
MFYHQNEQTDITYNLTYERSYLAQCVYTEDPTVMEQIRHSMTIKCRRWS